MSYPGPVTQQSPAEVIADALAEADSPDYDGARHVLGVLRAAGYVVVADRDIAVLLLSIPNPADEPLGRLAGALASKDGVN